MPDPRGALFCQRRSRFRRSFNPCCLPRHRSGCRGGGWGVAVVGGGGGPSPEPAPGGCGRTSQAPAAFGVCTRARSLLSSEASVPIGAVCTKRYHNNCCHGYCFSNVQESALAIYCLRTRGDLLLGEGAGPCFPLWQIIASVASPNDTKTIRSAIRAEEIQAQPAFPQQARA